MAILQIYFFCPFRNKVVKFSGAPPASVVPEKIYGKLLTWTMSAQEIRLLSASCNDNQSFLIEYTPYDQLMTVKRILESCFAASKNTNRKSHLNVEVSKRNQRCSLCLCWSTKMNSPCSTFFYFQTAFGGLELPYHGVQLQSSNGTVQFL